MTRFRDVLLALEVGDELCVERKDGVFTLRVTNHRQRHARVTHLLSTAQFAFGDETIAEAILADLTTTLHREYPTEAPSPP